MSHVTHIQTIQNTNANMSCHTYEWVMSHIYRIGVHGSDFATIRCICQYDSRTVYVSHEYIVTSIRHVTPIQDWRSRQRFRTDSVQMSNVGVFLLVQFMCVTWLICMCDMTYLCVWHDSFVCVTWFKRWRLFSGPIYLCDVTPAQEWSNRTVAEHGCSKF